MLLYFETILVYTLLTLLMCYGAYRSQWTTKQAHLWGVIPVIAFTLVFGLRYGVGIDYNNYLESYDITKDRYSSLTEMLENERYEPGFTVLLYICHYLNAPVYVFFSIIAFLQIFLIYKTFKNERNVLLYIYLTLILTGFCMYSFMNILRHEIAFCFFLYGTLYIRDNKPLKYWICCLLALAFHKSAIILFPLYFIWYKKKSILNKPFIEVCAVFGCFVFSFVSQWQDILHLFDNLIILLGYENYIAIADNMLVNNKIGVTRIITLLATLLIIANSKKIKSYFKSDLFDILYDLFVIGTGMSYMFLGSMMLQRIIVYFSNTQFIVMAYALYWLYETRRQKASQFLRYSILALYIVVSYSSFIYNCKKNTGAYISYFQKDLWDTKDRLRTEMLNQL